MKSLIQHCCDPDLALLRSNHRQLEPGRDEGVIPVFTTDRPPPVPGVKQDTNTAQCFSSVTPSSFEVHGPRRSIHSLKAFRMTPSNAIHAGNKPMLQGRTRYGARFLPRCSRSTVTSFQTMHFLFDGYNNLQWGLRTCGKRWRTNQPRNRSFRRPSFERDALK